MHKQYLHTNHTTETRAVGGRFVLGERLVRRIEAP